jgi:hypothetical protein
MPTSPAATPTNAFDSPASVTREVHYFTSRSTAPLATDYVINQGADRIVVPHFGKAQIQNTSWSPSHLVFSVLSVTELLLVYVFADCLLDNWP